MTNEAIAAMSLPRTRERILGELNAHRDMRDAYLKIACEFTNLHLPTPIVVAGDEIQPWPLPELPENLRAVLNDELIACATLERELYDAVQMRNQMRDDIDRTLLLHSHL